MQQQQKIKKEFDYKLHHMTLERVRAIITHQGEFFFFLIHALIYIIYIFLKKYIIYLYIEIVRGDR